MKEENFCLHRVKWTNLFIHANSSCLIEFPKAAGIIEFPKAAGIKINIARNSEVPRYTCESKFKSFKPSSNAEC